MTSPVSRRTAGATAVVVLAYFVAIAAAVGAGYLARDQHPLAIIAAADVAGTLVIFGFSLAFNNSSFYDPYWSVAPPLIGGYVILTGGGDAALGRQLLLMAIVGAWAVRLTYNWWRQWRGLGHEDWRYVDLRAKHGRAYWLVSLGGIHFFPTALVYAGCLSMLPALTADTPLGPFDYAATALGVFAVWIEATADRQLHDFVRSRPGPEAILADGVWGWCRNPNYLGELSLWYALALFAAAAEPGAMWVWAGPALMTFLFLVISIPMKERRMLATRPGFTEHRRRMPMLLPRGAREVRGE